MTPEQIANIRARALEIVALCDALTASPIGGPGGCRGLEMHRGGCSPFCAQHRGDDCLACDDGPMGAPAVAQPGSLVWGGER